MKELTMTNDEVQTVELDELEPLVLAKVTEVTGAAPGGYDDDNIVWGNI